MAFDLDKLLRAGEFSLVLNSIGLVRCKSFTSDLMSQASKRVTAPGFESKELARWLLGEVAILPISEQFQEADPIEGEPLSTEQLNVVTDAELEAFSDRVAKKNTFLVSTHKGKEVTRTEGQSACDFLAYAIEHSQAEEKARTARLLESVSPPLFGQSTLDSIKSSLAASNRFEDLIKKYAIGPSPVDRLVGAIPIEPRVLDFPEIHVPKNPIHETNQILENLSGRIDEMRPLVVQGAEMIRSMNETAVRMQGDYLENAARTDQQTSNAMKVAVASLVVSGLGLIGSTYFSYLTYRDGKVAADAAKLAEKKADEKSAAQKALIEEGISKLLSSQQDGTKAIVKSLAEVGHGISATKK